MIMRMRHRWMLICLLIWGWGIAAIEPIFHCDFDDTLVPVVAAGEKTSTVEVEAIFQEGMRGKALLVGMDEQKLRRGVVYPHEKNLEWACGAISFWVKPVNWKGTDTGFFAPFFTAWGGENYFLIYKYPVGEHFYFMRGELGFWLFSQYRPGEWQAGEWHHIVCNWNPVQLVMYVDGRLVTERRIYFPLKNLEPKSDFTIGETKKTIGSDGQNGRLSLIDELKIFGRMLTREEVVALYRAADGKTPPKNVISVPYGEREFSSSGFTALSSDEYALQQNIYRLSFDDQALHIELVEATPDACVQLTSPQGKSYKYSLAGGKQSIPLADIGLRPGNSGWQINIISGGSDLRGGARLILDKEMPALEVSPPYDLNKNELCMRISKASGVEMIFDTDTTFDYGFKRVKKNLDQDFINNNKNIADWTLAQLSLLKDEKVFYRSDLAIRKQQPTAVKFLYVLLDTRELFVAFQGCVDGFAVAEFCDTNGKIRFSEQVPMPEQGQTFFNLTFPIKAPAGDYVIKISHLGRQGKRTFLWDQELRIPPENDLKIAPYIDPDNNKLPPGGWTAVKSDASSVQIWGRSFRLDKGVLFSSMVSQGKELLVSPDTLLVDSQLLYPITIQLARISSDDLSATYRKTLDYDRFRMISDIKIAFDGYARIQMTLIPKGSLSVKELALELPLKNEQVKLVRDNDAFSKVTGIVKDSFTVSLLRIPSLWVGDYYTGINFTAENLINWHYKDAARHAEFQRDKDAGRLRFLLISAPLTVSSPREFQFGLTLTPVKPLDTALLRKREKKDWQLYSPWYHFVYLDPNRIKMEPPWNGMQYYNSQRKMFPTLFAYSAFNFAGPFWPEWTWYEEFWRQIKHNRTYGVWTGTKPYAYCEGCINCPDYRNFKLNMLRDFINLKNNPLMEPGTRNFYFDAPWEESCYNEKHGCQLWRDPEGKMHTHILVDVFRDKALNVWRMIKRIGEDSLVTYHSEWQRIMPYQSFQDGMYGGEGQEHQVAAKGAYYDILTPASFAATFSPYLWSAKMILIPQIKRGLELASPAKLRTYDLKKPEWRRAHLHYMGLAAVHDVDLSERTELSFQWWAAQDKLGWDTETVFHPYYADVPAVKTLPESERIVASAYTHSGRLMLAILNDTDEEQEVTVGLDLEKLGVEKGGIGSDVWEPEFSCKLDSTIVTKIAPRGFRLLLFAE